MGFDTNRILSKNPQFRRASLDFLLETVCYLQSKGIRLKDLPRIVNICPDVITKDIQKDFAPVFDFLSHDLEIAQENFNFIIRKCSRILTDSARKQLKPTLKFLRRLGIKNKIKLAYKYPHLLVLSLKDTIIQRCIFLLVLVSNTEMYNS